MDSPGQAAVSLGQGTGEMRQRIHAFDWSTTPLGPMALWPQSLRTVVNLLLSSRYAMWMAWGPELTFLCNDAYRPTLGIKDPWALGARADSVWAEIWPDIESRVETVLNTSRATYDEGLLLFLERSGFPEETYHTFSYSPLTDDDGLTSGMLCVVMEETDRVIGERRMETLRDVAAALGGTNTEDEVLQALAEQLHRNLKDLPFTLIYLFDESAHARLVSSTGIAPGHPLAAHHLAPDAESPWPTHAIFSHTAPRLLDDLLYRSRLHEPPMGEWNRPAEQAIVVPVRHQGQERPAGFLVAGINPYRRFDSAYSGFVDLLAGQIAAALANARAYQAERRRAESLAEIDRAKTAFFSNVSHELRTPLTLMLSPVEELLSQPRIAGDLELRQQLDLVHRNGMRLQRLVNTLLDFSRIEAGRVQALYEPTDLTAWTAELCGSFRSAMEIAGLEFQVACEKLTQPVHVDREMWEKVVLNLLSNALKYTFEGRVTVHLREADGYAELTVADTGTGIPQSELPRIFERFHRVSGARGRNIEGTGIGLALVQELVKLHGGAISVESEVSRGSRFTVRIPLGTAHLPKEKLHPSPDLTSTALHSEIFVNEALRWLGAPTAATPAKADGDPPAVAGARERVLVADDNPDMRDYVSRLLGQRYRVQAVSNGEEALNAALSSPPDLILSDVMMPGLDGFQLLQQLRAHQQTKTIPVVLLSARAGEESRVEGLGAGADDYLTKPFTARELMARVAAHLAMSRTRREAEEALTQSQATLERSNAELRRANSDLEQFAYCASHDLQEPLRQVAIYSQLLERKCAPQLDDKALEYLRYCVDGAHRMERLISDLLSYSQAAGASESPSEYVDTNQVLDTVKRNLATTIRETGAVISAGALPVVRGDAAPLMHVFQNLISNALKYRSGQPPVVTISAELQERFWRFAVRDNGIGIPPESHEKIFGLFKRLHGSEEHPGTGIGLAICQKVVERYGGQIWVESEEGRGSTFFFTLPDSPA